MIICPECQEKQEIGNENDFILAVLKHYKEKHPRAYSEMINQIENQLKMFFCLDLKKK